MWYLIVSIPDLCNLITLTCSTLLNVHSSFAIILMGKRKLVALLIFLVFYDCCVAYPLCAMVCLQFVIVVFPDHTHLLFLSYVNNTVHITYFKGMASLSIRG